MLSAVGKLEAGYFFALHPSLPPAGKRRRLVEHVGLVDQILVKLIRTSGACVQGKLHFDLTQLMCSQPLTMNAQDWVLPAEQKPSKSTDPHRQCAQHGGQHGLESKPMDPVCGAQHTFGSVGAAAWLWMVTSATRWAP